MSERSSSPGPEANPGHEEDADPHAVVEVARFRHRHEAELASGFLEDAGIPAVAVGDAAGQIQYGKGFSTDARVLVRGRDRSRALALLEDTGFQGWKGP